MNGAGNGDVELLRDAVLVPAHVGENDRVLRNGLLDVLQDALRRHGEAAVVGNVHVGSLEIRLGLGDLLAQTGALDALGADASGLFQKLRQRDLQVGDGADLHRIVAADLGGINVDLKEGGLGRIESHALIPAGAVRLGETRAETEDHISVECEVMRVLKTPEAGLADHQRMFVAQAALTHQCAGDRDIKELGQCGQLLGGLREKDAAARVQNGVLGVDKLFGDGSCRIRCERGLCRYMAVVISARPEILFDLAGEHIHGHVDQHRAGTAGLGKAERLIHDVGQGFGVVHAPGALDDRLKDAVLRRIAVHVDLLMRVLAEIVARHVAGNHNHGNGVERRVGDAGEDIGQAGAKVAQDHRRFVRQAGVAVGRRRSDGLVTVGDVLHLLASRQCVEHADDRVAAQTEYILHAAALQIIYHQVGNKLFTHITSREAAYIHSNR